MNLNFTIIGQIISFIFFTFFCMKYIWPVILSAINTRQNEIKNTFSSLEKLKIELNLRKIEVDQDIITAKKTSTEIINQVMKQKNEILEGAYIKAKQESDKILKRAHLEIAIEYQKARRKLSSKISELAIQIAEKIIEHSIDKSENSAIIKKLIAKI